MIYAVLKFCIDDAMKEYTISGCVLDELGNYIPVGYFSFDYEKAKNEFDFYSCDNGFECQRVIMRRV